MLLVVLVAVLFVCSPLPLRLAPAPPPPIAIICCLYKYN
jgi:hypothetical protein